MSEREIISHVLDSAYGPEHAQDIINDLTNAGYRILGPDELDQVTVERADAEVLDEDFRAIGFTGED